MANDNLFARLQPAILAAGNKPFLITPGSATLAFNDCDSLSGSLANLFTKHGLVAGDRLLTRTAKSPMALMVYLACLRSGIIHVPLNPACTPDELDYFVGDAAPTLYIGDPESCFRVEENHGIKALSLDAGGEGTLATAAAWQPAAHTVVTSNASEIAVLIYTSGTTGAPKGAMLSHGNLYANAAVLYDCWGWSGSDILLHCLPIFHVHGLFVATHLALLGASTMIFLPRFDSAAVLTQLPDVTVFMGVPTYYTRLLQEDGFDNAACRNIRLFISGSAPLPEDTFYAIKEKTGQPILERYGMSETGMLTSNPLNGERVAGTVGYPLAGVRMRVCDEVGEPVTPGGIGVLQVQGPNVFSGYWRKPELNAREFQDGYFITGDLVRVAEDGRISIVGRNKDMIISGGLNIYPKEIENVLDAQAGIRESAVFGIPHPDFGEGVVAAVVPEPGIPLDTDSLMTACREHLAGYKTPKRIVVLNDLPRNTMGKVQKNRLREQFANLFQNA